MIKAAIFASGTATNAYQLLKQELNLSNISFELLVTDNTKSGIVDLAREFNKPLVVIEKKYYSKEEHERLILEHLTSFKIDWIFLAGYMKILSSVFIEHFYDTNLQQSRIINIHPSLLPQFKGKDAYEQAYQANVKESGVSIHFVDQGVDTGKLIFQKSFTRSNQDSLKDFKLKGQKLEHELYPHFLNVLDNAITKNSYKDLL